MFHAILLIGNYSMKINILHTPENITLNMWINFL